MYSPGDRLVWKERESCTVVTDHCEGTIIVRLENLLICHVHWDEVRRETKLDRELK